VLVNGEAQPSCQIPATSVNSAEIVTIEGLQRNGRLHPLQEAFIAYDALQCGYCTPGMILKAHSLLARNPQPTEEDIAVEMDDNLCRCGSHSRIVQAIVSAGKRMQKGAQG
jgi:aerobic-type carbon monoxide dehydrogenase small subunit (CoxS/CutS family)